jgi:hypothetical protein
MITIGTTEEVKINKRHVRTHTFTVSKNSKIGYQYPAKGGSRQKGGRNCKKAHFSVNMTRIKLLSTDMEILSNFTSK